MLESFVQEALAHDLGTEISKTLANLRTENITTAGLLCSVLQLWPKPLENIANLTLGVCIALKNHAIQKGLIQNQDQKQEQKQGQSKTQGESVDVSQLTVAEAYNLLYVYARFLQWPDLMPKSTQQELWRQLDKLLDLFPSSLWPPFLPERIHSNV